MRISKKRKHAIIVIGLICSLMISCARERGRTDINLEMTDEDSVEAIIDHDLLTAGGTIVNLEDPEQTEPADAVTEVEDVELQTPVIVESDQSLKPAEDTETEIDSAEQPAMGLIDIEDVEIDSEGKTKEEDVSKSSADEETLSTEQLIAENKALISAKKEKEEITENSLPGNKAIDTNDELLPGNNSEKKNEKNSKIIKNTYQPAAVRPPNGSYYTEYTTMAETVKPAKPAKPADKPVDKPAKPAETADVVKDTSALTHTVKRGDTLWLISKDYGCTISELVAENGISRRAVLKIGQIIKIPKEKIKEELIQPAIDGTVVIATENSDGISSVTAKVITETVEKEVESPQSVTEIYTVESGDSYWKIAKKYGVTSTELMSLNNTSSSMIRVGQKILVPKK